MRTDFDWFDGRYVPDNDGDYLCEMEGIRFVRYATCRRSGTTWFIWIYCMSPDGVDCSGWCCLKPEWKIKRWCLIEEDDND